MRDEALAIKAFETLNDRGKPLTLLDKVKSFLMFYSFRYLKGSLANVINAKFGNIFMNFDIIKEIGTKEGIDYIRSDRFSEDELLRFFYHYFAEYARNKYNLLSIAYNYDVTSEKVFETFLKKSCNELKSNPVQLENFINEFLNEFDRFTNAFKHIISKVQTDCRYKKLFSFLGLNVRIYPLIISLEAENILNQQLLDIIESLDLRVYKVRGTDPRAGLYREAISQIKINPTPSLIYNKIKEFIITFMDDNAFRARLLGWIDDNPAVKYILWEFEKYQNPTFNDCDYNFYKNLQVEHIFPVNPRFNFPAYGFKDETEYRYGDINIYMLGNLTLLEATINKKVRNLDPASKANDYQRSNVSETKKLGFSISNRGFTKADLKIRTDQIINFCIQRWRC